MKLSIMQPYFIPYAGYFRLFCASDLFVVYDCVQFPRRSWVHRNQLYTHANKLEWLTLPVQKQPVDTLIKDLKFRDNVAPEWEANLNRFATLKKLRSKYPQLYAILSDLNSSPTAYIVNILREICTILDIHFNIKYSASLNLPSDMKGQDRILAIAKFFRATDYVNASGGRELYEESEFTRNGLRLHFLPEFQGAYHSILQYLVEQEPSEIKAMLISQSYI